MSDRPTQKYSDVICRWLYKAGYRKCFYVAGGNIMHILESASRVFDSIPVIHEVAAAIATEYFNEAQSEFKAFTLVTAGPGLTNAITGIGAAYLESRELLVIGGQVKRVDLSNGKIRQRGIQEIDGTKLVSPITKKSVRLDEVINQSELQELINLSAMPRKGPVFIEMPLDIQAQQVDAEKLETEIAKTIELPKAKSRVINDVAARFKNAERPVLLLGAGISRNKAAELYSKFNNVNAPIMTTFNSVDRIDSNHQFYFGRPNTWGQRYANLIVQQADLLVAVGSRLGMQQSGFNWQEFIPHGEIVQIDCDQAELDKGHPKVALPICADAEDFLENFLNKDLGQHNEWLKFARVVKAEIPLDDKENKTRDDYISPYQFYLQISDICSKDDQLISCSSGGAFTVAMQSIMQKFGQVIIGNKAAASMGYGLSGAIGAAVSAPNKRTLLFEGDGGFAQNLQEIGTAVAQKLNLKIFIFDDNGYASIRMTQKNYFGGKYVGCDLQTGLGLPNWEKLFAAYEVPSLRLTPDFLKDPTFLEMFNAKGINAFILPIDPEQTYFPKISSRVLPNGSMQSNPLHLMSPDLPEELMVKVGKYFK